MYFGDLACIDLTYFENNTLTNSKKRTLAKNKVDFLQWLMYLSEMGVNRYKVSGEFPETLDERTILQSIFWYGAFCLFNDNGVWLSLPGLPASDLTVYGYPRKINVFGRNGYNKTIGIYQQAGNEIQVNAGVAGLTVPDKQGFWIQERKTFWPLARTAITTAERISDTMRTLDVLRLQVKTPYMVFVQEELRNTVTEFFKKVKDNDELIISTGCFSPDKVQVQNLDFDTNKIKVSRELVEWYLSQYLNFCGINSNPASDKGERLLVDEVNANDEETDNNVSSFVDFMNNQLDNVNKITGWSMRMEANYENKDLFTNSDTLSKYDIPGDGNASRPGTD